MIDVKEILVSSEYGISKLVVSFKTSDSVMDLSRYRFDVYRSDFDAAGFVVVAIGIDSNTFIDTTVNLLDHTKHYYYKIGVTDLQDGTFKLSDVTGYVENRKGDVWGSAIIDIEGMWLENTIDNDEIYLIKQRTGGEICSCYDDVRKISNSDCPICYGTKYKKGFYPAEKIMVNYQYFTTTSETLEQRGIVDTTNPINFWTKNLPRIFPDDIIVGQNDLRYIVNSVNITYKNHYIIRQIVSATPIPKSDRRYKILLDGSVSE